MDGTLQREVKKVRKARNRRQEWNMMALDKELRPDHRHTIHRDRGASSEGSMSPENRCSPRLFNFLETRGPYIWRSSGPVVKPPCLHSTSFYTSGTSVLSLKPVFRVSFRAHGPDPHHYPNSMNHAGHAYTYSGPPPSVLAAQMAAGHGPRGGSEHDGRSRTMLAYQGGTLGRSHHQQVPLPPPPIEALNGGSMSLPPMDYRYTGKTAPPSDSSLPQTFTI